MSKGDATVNVPAYAANELTEDVLPPGGAGEASAVGAFFDMDNTLLSASSGKLYLKYLHQIGYLSWRQWARVLAEAGLYACGLLDFPHMMGRLLAHAAGSSEAEAWRLGRQWFEAMLRDYIAPGALECIAWHRSEGHHVAIVSASTQYAVRLIAEELGLGERFLATHLEVIDGQFTGRIVEPACYAEGKVELANAYAYQHGLDLSRSYFYSDSHTDLPLLMAVGHPVAVNPNRQLLRTARLRGWPVRYFY